MDEMKRRAMTSLVWIVSRKPVVGFLPPPVAPKPKLNRKINEDAVAEELPSSFADVSVHTC